MVPEDRIATVRIFLEFGITQLNSISLELLRDDPVAFWEAEPYRHDPDLRAPES